MPTRVWYVTGCSSGFGREIAHAVIARGDQLIATARNPAALADLVALAPDRVRALALDITDPASVQRAAADAIAAFGRIDVLVNNAGYGLIAALEETGEEQMRRNVETNFFGPLRVTRSVLPRMRAQKSGLIINISALAAFANHAGFAVYGGAKAGVEAALDALRIEAAPLGIKVTSVEPGPFRTDFIARSLEKGETTIADYDKTSGAFAAMLQKISGRQTGDPKAGAAAIVSLADVDQPPTRLVLGKFAYDGARKRLAQLQAELDQWQSVGMATDFGAAPR
ncbi:MAG: SDR family NAD(P)-dependent oxidoreductase [Phycisphaerales bacterium]|nr:SDR family NAD(P)-dependent oxidoreductase [Phycisphaerales bacterium]